MYKYLASIPHCDWSLACNGKTSFRVSMLTQGNVAKSDNRFNNIIDCPFANGWVFFQIANILCSPHIERPDPVQRNIRVPRFLCIGNMFKRIFLSATCGNKECNKSRCGSTGGFDFHADRLPRLQGTLARRWQTYSDAKAIAQRLANNWTLRRHKPLRIVADQVTKKLRMLRRAEYCRTVSVPHPFQTNGVTSSATRSAPAQRQRASWRLGECEGCSARVSTV